ncbi:hypothetical protein HDU82_002552 [Entophlyctis luteolus]|nr:hypothetical protein HDU82_002552 [Entophlyctis luteolus]
MAPLALFVVLAAALRASAGGSPDDSSFDSDDSKKICTTTQATAAPVQYCSTAPAYLSCSIDAFPVIDPFVGIEFHLQEVWSGAGTYSVLAAEEMSVSISVDGGCGITEVSLTCGSEKTNYTRSTFSAGAAEMFWSCDAVSANAVVFGNQDATLEIKYLYYAGSKASGGLCYQHDQSCPSAKPQVKPTPTASRSAIIVPTPTTVAPVLGKCQPNARHEVCEVVNDPAVNPFTGANFYVFGTGIYTAVNSTEMLVQFTMDNSVLSGAVLTCAGSKPVTVNVGSFPSDTVDIYWSCGSYGWVHLFNAAGGYVDLKEIWYYGNNAVGGLCYGQDNSACKVVQTVSTTAAPTSTAVPTTQPTASSTLTAAGVATSTSASTSSSAIASTTSASSIVSTTSAIASTTVTSAIASTTVTSAIASTTATSAIASTTVTSAIASTSATSAIASSSSASATVSATSTSAIVSTTSTAVQTASAATATASPTTSAATYAPPTAQTASTSASLSAATASGTVAGSATSSVPAAAATSPALTTSTPGAAANTPSVTTTVVSPLPGTTTTAVYSAPGAPATTTESQYVVPPAAIAASTTAASASPTPAAVTRIAASSSVANLLGSGGRRAAAGLSMGAVVAAVLLLA